nr:YkvA family protein [Mariprofundus aestuarium]
MSNVKDRLRQWAATLKTNLQALYLAAKHPETPWLAAAIAVAVVAYALSPIDLIPDFIPVIGYLDDLLIVPTGIWLAIHLIPDPVWQACREKALKDPFTMPKNRTAAAVVVLLWLLLALLLWLWLRTD